MATDVAPELHEPPAVTSESVVSRPTQRWFDPVMGASEELTVTVTVVKQPDGSV